MANSIYNGTFVLGNTSATTLSAGPGIKLDTSVPGVICVSNDETVLYSGSFNNGTTVLLSESITAFERVAFEGYSHNGMAYCVRQEAPVLSSTVAMLGSTYWPGSSEKDFISCKLTNNSAMSNGTLIEVGSTTNTKTATITKVVGINRKQTNGGV